jgi:flagellar motor protein MotB
MTSKRRSVDSEELNIWPSFTDLMSNAFMISMLLILLLVIKIPTKKQEQPKKAPPIIEIQDSGAYRFLSGSAESPAEMTNYLETKLVSQIEEQVRENRIDVIEIIGHTDAQPNAINTGNLDSKIQDVAANKLPISTLKASSNADLGLMRALTVVKILKNIQSSSSHLKGVKFRAYSAGQLILPRDIESADPQDGRRRRIEIRFTRDGKVTKVG